MPLRILTAVTIGLLLAGCAPPMQQTQFLAGTQPVTLRLSPSLPSAGQPVVLTVESPGADSIVFASANGLDRYSSAHGRLVAHLSPGFGDSLPGSRFGVRYDGQLLNRRMKPSYVTVCRGGRCDHIYHELPVVLPEENHRSYEVTAGYATAFAHRAFKSGSTSGLFRQALNSGVVTLQAEAMRPWWSARLHAYLGQSDRGIGLEASRVLKRGSDLSYGVAMHLDGERTDWLPRTESDVLGDRTTFRAAIGPSIMLRGVTLSSQFGVFADGARTLQVMSTRVSINGNLTEVRIPISISAERMYAFGGSSTISRRSEALERLTGSVHLVQDIALNFGVSSRRSAWPTSQPSSDSHASETQFLLGAQYSLSW